MIKEVAKPNPPKPVDRDRKYLLAFLSKLHDLQVHSGQERSVGRIVDFAVTVENHRLAYAAVEFRSDDAKLYPLPLSAFVVSKPEEPWQVDLSAESIANTPSFSARKWPQKIERAWVEYVHVRYGDAALDGVQHASEQNDH